MEIDRKLTALKELAVNVRNYEQYKNIGTGYKNAKNKESFFEAYESQLIILEAGEREIRAKGLDPGKISYLPPVFEIGLQRLSHSITGGFYIILTVSTYTILPSIAGGLGFSFISYRISPAGF